MTTTKAILTLGVLAVLVLSGAAFAVEETDAAVDPVQYVIGTVTYSSDAGISEDGSTVTLPTLAAIGASVPAGKAFLGWNATSATESTYLAAGTTTAYAAKFYAVMQDITYTVSFDAGNGSEPQTFQGMLGDELTVPEDPAKNGFIFAGWSTDGETVLSGIVAGASVPITADTVYVAVYTTDYTYTVIVDGTTIATGFMASYSAISDPSKVGYRFVGWSDGTGTTDDLAAAVRAQTADAVYVAVWEPMTYTVAFVADGEGVLTETIKHGELAIEPAAKPSKEGYDFAGWSADGIAAYDFSSAVTSDLTLIALFSETVVPDEPASVTYIVDGITVYDPATPSKEGYLFAGWADGQSIVSADELDAYIAALPAGASVTLTATWTPVVYTVTFVSEETVILTQSVKHGELATEPAVQPSKEGFDFAGWDHDFASPVTSDLAINAVYEESEAPVAPVDVTYIVDGLTVKGAETPSKTGYRFVGWSDGAAVITDVPAYLSGLAAGSSVVLTAVFEPEVYTVTFVSNGETVLTQSVKYGEYATVPAATPTNMDFDHWAFDFSVPITADTAIQAVAVVVVYHTVVFDYGYPGVASVEISVADGATVSELPVIYPYMGDVEWSITTGTPITADTTVTLQAVQPAEPEAPAEETDEGSGIAVKLAVVVAVLAAFAVAAILCVKNGVPAKLKAKAEARKAAKKADEGKEEPKP